MIMHDIAGGRYARRTHLLRRQIPIRGRACHPATGAQVASICAAFECVCACRLSRAEGSDLQLAVGESGHGAEFIPGCEPHLRRVAVP
jgi:hypothetical protein